jgi:hypothetical protein
MPFNIDEFVAQVDGGGLIRDSHFECLVSGPQGMEGGQEDSYQMVSRCEAVTEPGRGVITVLDAYHYGLPVARAAGAQFSEIDMTFIMSEGYEEKMFFERWIDNMVGDFRLNTSTTMYDVKYFDSYVGTIKIFRYNDGGDIVYTMTLKNAFPVAIGDIALDWSKGEQLTKLPVRFWFQSYTNEEE